MAEIVLDGIAKRFPDGTEAVRDIDLTIADGEFFILVGPSGCGKSTLLNLIVGLEEPTEGVIRVDGENVTGLDPRDRNMAMVFQSYALYPHMTVKENMGFPLTIAGRPAEEISRKVRDAAEMLELESLLDRKPASLSGGQRQRVAMGRAIVREPVAFLLDEPLSNLDAKLRAQMRTQIARLQRRLGTTTVYVTHDQAEAMTLGDHLAVLRRGRVQQVGTPRDLYEEPRNLFVAAFLGSPPMNLLPARVEKDRVILPMATLPLRADLREELEGARGDFVAGIRPEHLREAEGEGQEAGEETSHPTFRARVELVEWLGADLFVHLDVGAEGRKGQDALEDRLRELSRELDLPEHPRGARPLVARLTSRSRAGEGQSLILAIDPEKVMLFHPDTGERIVAG